MERRIYNVGKLETCVLVCCNATMQERRGACVSMRCVKGSLFISMREEQADGKISEPSAKLLNCMVPPHMKTHALADDWGCHAGSVPYACWESRAVPTRIETHRHVICRVHPIHASPDIHVFPCVFCTLWLVFHWTVLPAGKKSPTLLKNRTASCSLTHTRTHAFADAWQCH